MDFFRAMEVSASGLAAERTRLDVASGNLANASTTRTPEGGPYRRRDVVLETRPLDEGAAAREGGPAFEVQVAEVREDQAAPRLVHDPGHPDADPDGNVAYPNVNVIEEMVDMITASRAYEAGLSALNTATSMAEAALQIGGGS
ncbi:MAG: flagellar basal body rod protein FlgC [Deltaproteobacteria bacterium]|nr:flagellar basal body rod protein FlgC [Deltaproteobacteria bacterium]